MDIESLRADIRAALADSGVAVTINLVNGYGEWIVLDDEMVELESSLGPVLRPR